MTGAEPRLLFLARLRVPFGHRCPTWNPRKSSTILNLTFGCQKCMPRPPRSGMKPEYCKPGTFPIFLRRPRSPQPVCSQAECASQVSVDWFEDCPCSFFHTARLSDIAPTITRLSVEYGARTPSNTHHTLSRRSHLHFILAPFIRPTATVSCLGHLPVWFMSPTPGYCHAIRDFVPAFVGLLSLGSSSLELGPFQSGCLKPS